MVLRASDIRPRIEVNGFASLCDDSGEPATSWLTTCAFLVSDVGPATTTLPEVSYNETIKFPVGTPPQKPEELG